MALGERLAFLITADGAQAVGEFGKIAAAADAASAKTKAKLGEANGLLGSLGISGAAAAVGIGAGIAAAGKLVESGVSSFVRLTDTVRQFQSTSGASASDASKLVFASRELGVSTDTLASSFFRLGANVQTQPQKFAQYGVAVAHAKDGTVDLFQTFQNLLNRMNELGPGASADTLAKALIGRGAATVAPLAQSLNELISLEQQASTSGAIVSEADIQKGLRYKAAVAGLSAEVSHLTRDVGSAAIPVLARMANGLDVEAHAVGDAAGWLGRLVGVQSSHQAATDASAAATDGFTASTAGSVAALAAQQAQLQADAVALQQHDAAVTSLVSTLVAQQSADQAVADAKQKVAQAGLGEAQKVRDVANATQSLTAANESLAKAEYDQGQAAATAAENQQRNALAVKDSAFAVADAQDAANRAVLEYGANSRQAAEAADAVASAQLNHQDAVRKQGAPDTTVQDAANAVADARDRQRTAQDAVNKAEAEDPAAALTKANQDLATAVLQQRDAQRKAFDALQDTTVATGVLKAEFDGMIADLVAAGANPAVIAAYTNIEGAAIAARNALIPQSGEGETLPPGAVGPVAPPAGTPVVPAVPDASQGAAAAGGYVGAAPPPEGYSPNNNPANNPDMTNPSPGLPPASGQSMTATHPKTQSVTNITVNATSQADPNEIAHAIVFAQAVRR